MVATLVIGLSGLIVLTMASALAYRAICQRRTARSLVIRTPNGIAEGRYVRIGGIDQWIQIRGEDRANPILLFLHGSGMSMIPFTPVFRSWEQYFTVVQWDRTRFGVPVYLLHGAVDQHTLTGLVEEYYPVIEAPAKNLVLLPGGGHCAVLMQPATFLAALRSCVGGVVNAPSGICRPGSC